MKIHVLISLTKSHKDACTCCLYQDTKFGSTTSEIEILNEHLQLWTSLQAFQVKVSGMNISTPRVNAAGREGSFTDERIQCL